MNKIDLTKITPEQRAQIIARAIPAIETALGITPERAAEFLAKSEQEHPEKDAEWHRKDAIGKFKHFLRVDHHWQGAVDAAWLNIEPYATVVVDAVLATG